MKFGQLIIRLFIVILAIISNEPKFGLKIEERQCSSLLMGQFKCTEPLIDDSTQSAINCSSKGIVKVPCYPATDVVCENRKFDGKTIGFYREVECRYVTRYHYQTAVLLSVFLGIFGADRIYLGYMAVGVVKACTFGFMLVGYLVDIILIVTQSLGPSEGSKYIVDYYGQILYPSKPYNNNTFNLTFEL